MSETARHPVRAALALSGGGSLGTWLAGAGRELVLAIRAHNAALAEHAPPSDLRYLRPDWGRITVDALGGASAGALVSAQLVRAIFEPDYLGPDEAVDLRGSIVGDWVHGGNFGGLSSDDAEPRTSGPVEAPGWTLMSGALLYDLCTRALGSNPSASPDAPSPLDRCGFVGVGITLTDLLGFHEPAEFEAHRVLGHSAFGRAGSATSRVLHRGTAETRDMGGRGHAEVRKLFVAVDERAADCVRHFLVRTRRRSKARVARWGRSAGERLAALCAASAALPLAVGPVAVSDWGRDASYRYRRLYMDGGIMNNKPLAPALRLARWHDLARLVSRWDGERGEFDVRGVEEELVYERVLFFVDAFPERSEGDWRSIHPDEVRTDTGSWGDVTGPNDAREKRITEALATPFAGMSVFFESIMTSLRAQDLRQIAKVNARLDARDRMIDRLCESAAGLPPGPPIDTIERATAFAAVRARALGRSLSDGEARAVAAMVADSDTVSELSGRRTVTLVPVFAPNNLRAAYAGDAMYSMGGLLALDARRHDAGLGGDVARKVLRALRDPGSESHDDALPTAPESVLPTDAGPLATRLVVAALAMIDGLLHRSPVIRFFAKLPLWLSPIVSRFKRWLDTRIRG